MTRYEVEQRMKARNRRELKVKLIVLLILVGFGASMTEF